MGSKRVSLGLCIVMLVGAVAAVPAAVSAQQDQVTITATIVNQQGQSVGDGVDVTATWDGGSTSGTTASNGQVLIDAPRGANVSIQVEDDRYIRNQALVVEDAETESVEVPVARSATAEITVRNTDNETVEGARVFLYRGSTIVTSQQTDADGTVTTPAVEEGSYQLGIQKAGYFTSRTEASVSGQAELNRTIEQGEVLLTVSVEDDYFEPPETLDAAVEVPGAGTLQTGDDGDATTSVPVNTRYELTVTKDGYDRTTQRVNVGGTATNTTVSLDRTDEIIIDASDRAVIGQRVDLAATDEYDDPVTGATVTQDGSEVGTTDDDGRIRVTPQTAGNVSYTIDDGDTTATVTINVFDPDATPTGAESTAAMTENATTTEPPTTSGGSGPGFTPVTVAAALALLSLVAYRRR